MKIYTLGFARKSAEEFFTLLDLHDVKRIVDVRLSNASQLAGFTKKGDLAYFLRELLGMGYAHLPELAPSRELFDAYRKEGLAWDAFEAQFLDLMAERRIEARVDKAILSGGCLLCSEPTAEQCHRRLVAEYLRDRWGDVEIVHL